MEGCNLSIRALRTSSFTVCSSHLRNFQCLALSICFLKQSWHLIYIPSLTTFDIFVSLFWCFYFWFGEVLLTIYDIGVFFCFNLGFIFIHFSLFILKFTFSWIGKVTWLISTVKVFISPWVGGVCPPGNHKALIAGRVEIFTHLRTNDSPSPSPSPSPSHSPMEIHHL